MRSIRFLVLAGLTLASQAYAQALLPTSGTLVIVPASGEVTHANDEATADFMIEEQDKDKAAAASRVNQKMKQGMEIIRAADTQAVLKSHGYYTFPVYPDVHPLPNGAMPKAQAPTGWRVGQQLQVKTTNLNGLARTVAAAQRVLALNGLQFGLAPATLRKLDDQRIAATYQNLNERVASIAAAMGRKLSDAVLDTVDFEGSGNYTMREPTANVGMRASASYRNEPAAVAEPSFEPGETTLQMRLVGKVKFK
jgi:uncharacterized protein